MLVYLNAITFLKLKIAHTGDAPCC